MNDFGKFANLAMCIALLMVTSVSAQIDRPRPAFGTDNPPKGDEPETFEESDMRTTLEENEKLIVRTIEFMISETSLDDYLANIGELLPEQSDILQKQMDEFEKKSDEIRSRSGELARAYEQKHGRPPSPKQIETLVNREIKKLQIEFYSAVSTELLDHQKYAIAKWRPQKIGIAKTLTETPIGKTLGLSEKQLDEIRERSNEIGVEYRKAYMKARSETIALFEEVLTEQQAKKIKELYYPGARTDRPFASMSSSDMISKLPSEPYVADKDK